MSPETAYSFCREKTRHYENFPVASFLIPSSIRKHIYAVYAFARTADDFADEHSDRDALLEWRKMLHQCVAGPTDHPIFFALADTIKKFDLPVQLFDDLITAFLMDLDKNRHPDFNSLMEYCRFSANPVGRIILHLFGYRGDLLFHYSDNICTALQLTNFWQDVRIDARKNRIYIPKNLLQKYQIPEEAILQGRTGSNFEKLMNELVQRTRHLFENGRPLLQHVRGRLKLELKFTLQGGMEILNKIEKANYNIFKFRPALNSMDWIRMLIPGIMKG